MQYLTLFIFRVGLLAEPLIGGEVLPEGLTGACVSIAKEGIYASSLALGCSRSE